MKKVFFLLGIVFTFCQGYAQGDDFYGNYQHYFEQSDIIENPSVQPPDVATFQKVNFIPVNNYTGRANISVPIFEIQSGNMKVPISLSYNTSGIKVNDRGSSVGMNWSLNAGGVISKIVKGMEDFTSYDSENLVDIGEYEVSPVGWLYPKHIGLPNNDQSYGPNNDHLPDLFIVTAPGINTRYVHERSIWSTPGQHTPNSGNGNVFELTGQNNRIIETYGQPVVGKYNVLRQIVNSNDWEYYDGSFDSTKTLRCFEKIEVTSTYGIEYTFNDMDVSQYTYYNERDPDATGIQSLWNQWKTERKVESYRLSKMQDHKTNKVIEFEYEAYSLGFYDPPINRTFEVGDFEGPTSTESFSTKYPRLNRLTEIQFDEGSIHFTYAHTRQDITGEKALTKIEVKDNHEKVIKTFHLEYSYYQTTGSSVAQGKRLRLDKVYESSSLGRSKPAYEFTYNNTELPERGIWGSDFLGYHNGSYLSSLSNPQPKVYFYPNQGIFSSLPFNNGSGYYQLSGNYSLASNLAYAKSGILEKIKYPTGGITEIEYELNEFSIGSNEIQGGGLRIKSQKIVDENLDELILDYEYEKSIGHSSGSIISLPKFSEVHVKSGLSSYPASFSSSQTLNYLGFKIYQTSRSQAELTNNSFVGYSKIKVKQSGGNGYSVYEYTSPEDFPIEIAYQQGFDGGYFGAPSPDALQLDRVDMAIRNGKYSISIDRDIYRGKLLSARIYNESSNLLEETINNYLYKKFDTIALAYDIKLCNSASDCYDGRGLYEEHGILETSGIPSERYLLNTMTKKEYLPSGYISEVTNYVYDATLPRMDNVSFENSDNNSFTSNYYYTNRTEFITQNRLFELEKKEITGDSNELLFKEEIVYDNFGDGVIDVKEFKRSKGTSTKQQISIVMNRDSSGNITESQRKDGSTNIVIWGYNEKYPIAKIENATYADVTSQVTNLQTLSNLDDDRTFGSDGKEGDLRDALDTLRNTAALSDALVTTYTYDPLIGVTSITDPKGQTVYYKYDDFNRLEYVLDDDQNVISKNEYHYKGQ